MPLVYRLKVMAAPFSRWHSGEFLSDFPRFVENRLLSKR